MPAGGEMDRGQDVTGLRVTAQKGAGAERQGLDTLGRGRL